MIFICEWLLGLARIHISPDISLLGLPGWKFWHAHLRCILLYGKKDWVFRRKFVQDRHLELIKDHKFELAKNWKGSLYVNYRKMTQTEMLDELTRLSQEMGDYN